MRNIVAVALLLFLVGCGTPSPSISTSIQANLSDHEVNRIVHETMQQIHSDLKELKGVFPQLVDIDSAQVTSNRFHYSKGWVSDSKTKGVTFEKNGCDIGFWTTYPAQSTDFQQLVGSPFKRLGNGKYLKFWRLVRAERTEQANKFKGEVNGIISENISDMLDSLGHKQNDHVFQLSTE